MNKEDETEAIHRCQQGDISGLEPLVLLYQTQALRTAYLLVKDRRLAEDIVQDSFLTAYHHIAQFDATRPFTPWFYRIVLNTARQMLRAHARHPTVSLQPVQFIEGEDSLSNREELLDTSGQYDPVLRAEQTMEKAALLDALALLTVKQRSVIILRYYCDFTEREIAQLLGCLPGTVRWRLHSGLRALERIIRQEFPYLVQERWAIKDQTKMVALAGRKNQ